MESTFDDARYYSFFQINKLLHRHLQKKNAQEDSGIAKKGTVRYRANDSLSFPASDIENIRFWRENDKDFAEVVVNFMGLYGPSSPLPVFFTERILFADQAEPTTRDFLDLFNHRFIDLLQQCWEKYRYFQCYEDGRDDYSQWMFSLAGISHIELCEFSELSWHRLMPYAGLIAQKVINSETLARIIEGYFDIPTVEVEQCVLRDVTIMNDQLNSLGIANCQLGGDLVLSNAVQDRMGKIRIHISDLSVTQYQGFLTDGEQHNTLKQLIKFLMRDQLDFDIALKVVGKQHLSQILRDTSDTRLGWGACLGEPEIAENYVTLV